MPAVLVWVLLAGPLAAFGGAYGWSIPPLLGAAIVLAAVAPLHFDRSTRVLDAALAAIAAGMLVQLAPLPPAVIARLSPARARVAGLFALSDSPGWAPLSVNPQATIYALAVVVSAILTFFACRTVLAHRGVRGVCRAIAWLGLWLGCAGMLQRAVSPARIYGFWSPRELGALPFGPFVNRNHAATWLVMGASACVGYLMARLYRPAADGRRFVSVAHSIDSRAVWLALAGTTMVVALGVSLSQSGALGLAASAAVLLTLGRSRFGRQGTAWILAVVMVAGVVLVTLGQFGALLNRVVETAVGGPPARFAIWRDTLTAVQAFWLAGSGAGTYAQAMVAYQTTDRAYYFSQAHNHYLQVAAEGGLLLIVPVLLAAVALARLVAARLREDGSGVFWIRAGAAAGLAGVAVQSAWETGLRLPANAELAAVLAALATHAIAAAEPPRT